MRSCTSSGPRNAGFLGRIHKASINNRFDAIVVVFDVSYRDSFDNLRDWFREINRYATEETVKIIVGNKMDVNSILDEAKALAVTTGVNWQSISDAVAKKRSGRPSLLTVDRSTLCHIFSFVAVPVLKAPNRMKYEFRSSIFVS